MGASSRCRPPGTASSTSPWAMGRETSPGARGRVILRYCRGGENVGRRVLVTQLCARPQLRVVAVIRGSSDGDRRATLVACRRRRLSLLRPGGHPRLRGMRDLGLRLRRSRIGGIGGQRGIGPLGVEVRDRLLEGRGPPDHRGLARVDIGRRGRRLGAGGGSRRRRVVIRVAGRAHRSGTPGCLKYHNAEPNHSATSTTASSPPSTGNAQPGSPRTRRASILAAKTP